jgi:uncharacterized protein
LLALFGALPHISLLEKEVFRQTLKTTLVKDYTDIPVFDKCFNDFFSPGNDPQAAAVYAFRDMGAREIIRDSTGMSPAEMAALEKAFSDFLDSLPDDLIHEKSRKELFDLFMAEQAVSAAMDLDMIRFNERNRNLPSGRRAPVKGEEDAGEMDPMLADALMHLMENRINGKRIGSRLREREEYLLNKLIYQITPEEIKEMNELIHKFGQKLKNRISLRKKRFKHGGIDIKRTLRSSLQYGGIPFKIFRKDRKIERPELVVLCDISGSVNQYSRFMLLLTYTLQSLFSKVRTFAFISNIVEITPLFMEMNPERAINSIFDDTSFTYGWGSNYGKCFEQFTGEYSSSLTRRTTVLVLGDGRNNYQNPGLNAFITIKERSRNILWLNPDKRHLWNWADSIAYIYSEYCDEMREVNNFLDLSEFIDKLFINIS